MWYVDSGASNHMTGHVEWMQDARKMEKSGFVETGDNTAHPIVQTGKIPLSMLDGKKKYLSDVFHVPNITKNLVCVGQMVEQGLQVRFNPHGCFVDDMKNKRCLIAKGKKKGMMFTLDVDMPGLSAAMFAHGTSVVADIDILHKRIGHVNIQ